MQNSERFFSNRECRFFPCHDGIEESEFNCLFCYCPLYFEGKDCGGDFQIRDGIKSCINCTRPHRASGFDEISSVLRDHIRKNRVT